ncbi:MAG: 30S ribosomal protein S6 [Bacteroidetes bacterium]|nr:30S ribosomal protein S6 [Bacteroidota bacterium]
MTHTGKRTYETTFIVSASLDDSQIESVINRAQDTITKGGGSITAFNKWGRKRLSYPINKKTTGFYVNIEFEAPGTAIALLKRSFQLDEMILRHLTITIDAKVLKARQPAAETEPEPQPEPAPVPGREPLFSEKNDTQQENTKEETQ